jgi:hypothetical protein
MRAHQNTIRKALCQRGQIQLKLYLDFILLIDRQGNSFTHFVLLQEINSYFAFLFELIVARGPSVGLNVSLSRFDLFHGHLLLASETGRLGIL